MPSVNTLLAVKDLMNPDIVTAPENSNVQEAARLISGHKVSSVVVTGGDGKIIGIVTEKDIVVKVVAEDKAPTEILVKDIMGPDVHGISGESSIFDARAHMAKLGVKHLIVEKEGKPIGLISATTLLGGA